ncbi:MAG: ABC transporter ATP-binding protein [Betaproteobacteria bacterium]|nr:ABC transporter ATP-binding protein [Betaproteobacteria bacterium]
MSSESAIRVSGVGKCYHIYRQPRDRLLQFLSSGRKSLYREFWAVRNVSFDVRRGESVGIIGRNGSGKSTLLQIVCGTLTPTQGEVDVRGRVAALLELGAGFSPDFTGRENVFINGSILGLSTAELERRYEEIIDFAEIGEFVDQPIKTFSSGMVVRLAFAIQACVEPDILVVDEALAVGDERFQRKCFARIEDLKRKGTSILFVSHVAETVLSLCDRVLLLDHGQRLAMGAPLATVRAYQRLIYAPREEQESLARQMQEGDSRQSLDSPGTLSASSPQEEEAAPPSLCGFDPDLVPTSTVSYPVQGAEIEDIRIVDDLGRVVNVLEPGRAYTVISAGIFHGEARLVHFGIHLRSINGIVVAGQRYPHQGETLERVPSNSRFEVRFRVEMRLPPGCYFIGGGVWSNHEPQCLHRIVDKAMFRMLSPERQYAFGLLDSAAEPPRLQLRRDNGSPACANDTVAGGLYS